jgi:hypothetical protein
MVIGKTVIKDSCYEKVHHSDSGALRGGDAGLLHKRTPDNDDRNASDYNDHGIAA